MLIINVKIINKLKYINSYYFYKNITRLLTTQGCLNLESQELTNQVKHSIESHWRQHFPTKYFNDDNKIKAPKFYVLSMFPYPSGNLHMGHVRVYTISDTMARFYRMNGHNVLHPMGWDAFGLPAENAAIQHNIPAAKWTNDNILKMKSQLINLGCSFDWDREIATCNENYYKWTQVLFLKLYNDGLAYQKEALVNWDPIDKTVLADEQVDENGCSWRSGAIVEKRLLKQWFIKTTKFAKQLYDGLDDPQLQDWKDIINLQKHWIGECNGYSFELPIVYSSSSSSNSSNKLQQDKNEPRLNSITIWTEYPERLLNTEFIILTSQHILNRMHHNESIETGGIQNNFKILNPFINQEIPVIICDDYEFPIDQNVQIGCPSILDTDKILAKKYNLIGSVRQSVAIDSNSSSSSPVEQTKEYVLNLGKQLGITGGYLISSKLRDWLISRQRYWGTPIPIVHCPNCGTVPVPENELPVILPKIQLKTDDESPSILRKCPKCLNDYAKCETDTMDTFVDSSWYFLRYLDSQQNEKMFDEKLANNLMPVDLYIGGKEHAVLHLYYARFINHYLHSKGLLPQSEPFKRLLVQGMVMGRSYKLKDSGRYLSECDVEIINLKINKCIEKSTKKEVIMQWEKMSKSKFNGIDPIDIINEYGIDTTRLIILADVAPTSHRNWSSATFPGILKWQKRLWLTINDFHNIRNDQTIQEDATIHTKSFQEQNLKLYDARNYYIKGTTFNYRHSHQLSVAISKMQGLTNSLRRTPKEVIKYGKEYERTLATQIIMLAPMAPHFASELWSHFISINRVHSNTETMANEHFNLDVNVLEQKWPEVDQEYELDLEIKMNGVDIAYIKYPRYKLDKLTFEEAVRAAMENDAVKLKIGNGRIDRSTYVLYPGCEARLSLFKELSSVNKPPINEQQNVNC